MILLNIHTHPFTWVAGISKIPRCFESSDFKTAERRFCCYLSLLQLFFRITFHPMTQTKRTSKAFLFEVQNRKKLDNMLGVFQSKLKPIDGPLKKAAINRPGLTFPCLR